VPDHSNLGSRPPVPKHLFARAGHARLAKPMADLGSSGGSGSSSAGSFSGSGAGGGPSAAAGASDLSSWSIRKLKRLLRQHGVNTSRCTEKRELVALTQQTAAAVAAAQPVGGAAAAAAAAPAVANSGGDDPSGMSLAGALLASMRALCLGSDIFAEVRLY
jgi:hypothetical protein